MKKINLTQIAVWITLIVNVILFTNIIPLFMKDYKESYRLVWRMDSTQNKLIKELVDTSNKMVDNQKILFERLNKLEKRNDYESKR